MSEREKAETRLLAKLRPWLSEIFGIAVDALAMAWHGMAWHGMAWQTQTVSTSGGRDTAQRAFDKGRRLQKRDYHGLRGYFEWLVSYHDAGSDRRLDSRQAAGIPLHGACTAPHRRTNATSINASIASRNANCHQSQLKCVDASHESALLL